MYIPEELLKMSEKELDKTLVPRIFENKYVIYKDEWLSPEVFKIISKYPGGVVLKPTLDSNILQRSNSALNVYFKPLTKEKLSSLLAENTYKNIEKLTNEQFIDYYYNKAIFVFGEDYVSKNSDSITIHFPEVTIKNSVEQSLILKDIYFQLHIFNGRVEYVEMTRTTASEKELRNNYLFSHLRDTTPGVLSSNICYGSDTPIRKIKDLCVSSSVNTFKNINTFFFLLKEFVSWESLEGTPYRYMDAVITDANKFVDASLTSPLSAGESFEILKNHLDGFTYTYQLIEGNYAIKLTKDAINKIDDVLTSNLPDNKLYYRLNDRSVRLSSSYADSDYYEIYNDEDSEVEFKGETIKIKIEKNDEDSSIEFPRKVHVEILKSVVNLIEAKLKTYILNKKLSENV